MTGYDRAVYARGRAAGMPASAAFRLARTIAADRLEIPSPGERPLRISRDGFDVAIRTEIDDLGTVADLGYGTFDDGREGPNGYRVPTKPGAIPNPNRDSRNQSNGAPFYVPATARAERIAYYNGPTFGASRSVALDLARADETDELDRLTHDYGPSVVGVIATASRAGVELGTASVWGVELAWSAVTRSNGTEYLAEVADDEITEAIEDARTALAALPGAGDGRVTLYVIGIRGDERRVIGETRLDSLTLSTGAYDSNVATMLRDPNGDPIARCEIGRGWSDVSDGESWDDVVISTETVE